MFHIRIHCTHLQATQDYLKVINAFSNWFLVLDMYSSNNITGLPTVEQFLAVIYQINWNFPWFVDASGSVENTISFLC